MICRNWGLLRRGRRVVISFFSGDRNFQPLKKNGGHVTRAKQQVMVIGCDGHFLNGDQRRARSCRAASERDAFKYATWMREIGAVKSLHIDLAGPIFLDRLHTFCEENGQWKARMIPPMQSSTRITATTEISHVRRFAFGACTASSVATVI